MKRFFRSIPPPGALAPAMALLEVLVAGAVLGTALVFFFGVLRDGHADIARARSNTLASQIAFQALAQAQLDWPSIQSTGRNGRYTWTLSCTPSSTVKSPRLELIRCQASVTSPEQPALAFATAFAHVRPQGFLQ
ncbi:MAG: hypothetical protein ABUS48_01335 [Pseudomonadota bacterium]